MLSKFKRSKYQQPLCYLPKLPQAIDDIQTLYCPKIFRSTLLTLIAQATRRIYLIALYFEKDEAGQNILTALYRAKKQRPKLEICLLVDWHRAQRCRIGDMTGNTNVDWYCQMAEKNEGTIVPIYGVAVNTREALGVLHLKGSIIDDNVIYSGASINDAYLYQHDKYRYDRYQLIKNPALATVMLSYIKQQVLNTGVAQRLDRRNCLNNSDIKSKTRHFRLKLRDIGYQFTNDADNEELAVTPLVGLGKKNPLNNTIDALMCSTQQYLIICIPYFNLPTLLIRNITYLLQNGKQIEIIVGDKTANDFYIPENQPFKMIGTLPYLYEINLRRFFRSLQQYVDIGQLIIRLWKDGNNSYHLKGIWIDDKWQLITGNNLNLRAWHLDLENAILIHDPQYQMQEQRTKELLFIRRHTRVLTHYLDLDNLQQYPNKVQKLIRRMRSIHIDRLINRIL
ncbi:CDP-diacylglycerol--serine O-phosphatidyltransferase [Candidatus Fukatsuia anoeciicola]|uniref:CDP-diacylglycerol--serine O-phosphatidyltransferase n=1 Tax=Candidatus Fukatsuia anoeciicola TaxID=2994492 RepID=UPI003463F224